MTDTSDIEGQLCGLQYGGMFKHFTLTWRASMPYHVPIIRRYIGRNLNLINMATIRIPEHQQMRRQRRANAGSTSVTSVQHGEHEM